MIRIALVIAMLANSALAAPKPRPAISIYPRVTSSRGTQTIELDVVNHTAQPVTVCANESHCLELELKGSYGTWENWKRSTVSLRTELLRSTDFVVIPPKEERTVFSLPFVRTAGTRDFAIGVSHHFANLPGRTEYRFTYRLDRSAAGNFEHDAPGSVAEGPEGSSASPMTLLTFDDAEIVAAVKAGQPDAERYVQPGDAALVASLDPLLASSDYSVAESAVRCVSATETSEAVNSLLAVLASSHNAQLRNVAATGFRRTHPRARAPKLIEALAHEHDDGIAASIVLALGEMNDPSLLPELQLARAARHATPIDAAHATEGTDFAFELVGARLHAAKSVRALRERMRVASAAFSERSDTLAQLFREVAYTHDPAVALLVTDFFSDNRLSTQVLIDVEKDAYVRVADDALFAVLAFFPDEPWGIEKPLRRFTEDEQRQVRTVVERRVATH